MSQNSRLNEEKTAIDRICFLPREKDSKTVRKVKKTNYSQEQLIRWLYFRLSTVRIRFNLDPSGGIFLDACNFRNKMAKKIFYPVFEGCC